MPTKRQREAIYDECIKHGHWMEDAPPSTPSSVTFGFVLRCARGCETHRHLEIHPATGQVTGSSYAYDPAYLEYRQGKTRAGERLADALERRKRQGKRRLRAV